MKNLKTRGTYGASSADIIDTMSVDRQQEYNISYDEYTDQVSEAARFRTVFFNTGDGRGLVVRRMYILDVLHAVSSKIKGVRLTTRKRHVGEATKITEHVYIHINDEPFYRAVLYFMEATTYICSPQFDTDNVRPSLRGFGLPEVTGSSYVNCVGRSLSLKRALKEIVSVVRIACAARPVSVNDFIDACFDSQSNVVGELSSSSDAVSTAVTGMIGKGYRFGSEVLGDDIRAAALFALESVVRKTPMPPVSAAVVERLNAVFSTLDAARADAAATTGKVPVQIVKLKGNATFFAKVNNNIFNWQELPDAVMVPAATVMSLGSDAVLAGVGRMRQMDFDSAIDLNMVVMVDAEANL